MATDFIPLSEASRILGLGVTTIRSWCQLGKVECQRTANAQWLINLDSARGLIVTSKSGASAGNRMVTRNALGGRTSEGHTALERPNGGVSEEHLRDLRDALARERQVAEDFRTQNRELQSQLLKLAAEMHAILARDGDGKLSRWFRR